MLMGIIRGVTTNPTILRKEGLTGGMKSLKKTVVEIARAINPYPVSVSVTTNRRDDMIAQAKEFSGWAENINVKIPVHGPGGELENLEVVHILEKRSDIRVNVTAMMSAQQCFLAALAGATYVSLFGGRVNDMGYNCIDEIAKLRNLIDEFDLEAKIVLGSTREVLNITEWLEAGADVVTVTPELLRKMLVHPYTKETVRMFLDDAREISNQ